MVIRMDTSQSITLTVTEIVQATGISRRTIARRANKENWQHEESNGKGGIQFNYYISRLPLDIQQACYEKMGIVALGSSLPVATHSYQTSHGKSFADTWTDETALNEDALRHPIVKRNLAIIRKVEECKPPDIKRRKWIETVALEYGLTFQTVYEILKKHYEKGVAGSIHRKSTKGKPKLWDSEAVEFWIRLCLKRSHRKINKKDLYEILALEAQKRDWVIGSYKSALWWYDKKATPQLLALQRGGMRALDNTLPPVLRDYSDLEPFEILVGDQHRFDFWVVDDDTGEVFRPEGYLWQDLRTRVIYGAAIDRRYDASLIGLALSIGVNIFGAFGSIYTDNGKPELSRYLMNIMEQMGTLDLNWQRTEDYPTDTFESDPEELNPLCIVPGTHKKAIVKNAKAKLIEGTFCKLEEIIRSKFRLAGSTKRLSDDIHAQDIDHKEAMQLAAQGKLPTFAEFAIIHYRALDYYNREKPHRGVLGEWSWKPIPKTTTPYDCLIQCYRHGWKPRILSEHAVNLIFLARQERKVDRGLIRFNNDYYEHDALIPMHGKWVDIRYNPMKLDDIIVFYDKEYICVATPITYSSMKDSDLAKKMILRKRERRKRISDEYRIMTKNVPDFRQYSEIPVIEKTAALIEADKKRRAEENYERNRVLTEEELRIKVEELERLQTLPIRPATKKPLTERPQFFMSDYARYDWCIRHEAQGGELSNEDKAFIEEYESQMEPQERDACQFRRNYWRENGVC